ncbi:hypothetical protein [Halodesulfovibrio sp.]|uniref:hypothetical protein n=1 Tax=Halodesulfovibrio sp. TaxID=1912772 RepID=UPI0025C2E2C7|nr:hypothetical protein [Halodesulfovibrio sp.]
MVSDKEKNTECQKYPRQISFEKVHIALLIVTNMMPMVRQGVTRCTLCICEKGNEWLLAVLLLVGNMVKKSKSFIVT